MKGTPPFAALILAAGKGTRMKSRLAKVLHPIAGVPMLQYTIDSARQLMPEKIVVVIGHQAEQVRDAFKDQGLIFVEQREQLGTGHAVESARPVLGDFEGTTLILCADTPLMKPQTLRGLMERHRQEGATITILTAIKDNPSPYGRIIRNQEGRIIAIVEENDATDLQKGIKEINTGTYCVETPFLFQAIKGLDRENIQREYYLTEIVRRACGRIVAAYVAEYTEEFLGINTRYDLAVANEICNREKLKALMLQGVTVIDPKVTYVDRSVHVGKDTLLYPNCYLMGRTVIGERCTIEPGVKIVDSTIEDGVTIKASSVITESTIEAGSVIGPFAHLRPESRIGPEVKIGNFVEVKKSTIRRGSKASHLSYIGDATLGERVNIGCGTITCNYDGKKKHPTIIEDDVFVGSDTQFVAPVRIGRDSIIGAGSTITKDVPPNSLAVSRAKQVNLINRGRKRSAGKKAAQKPRKRPR